MALSLNPVAVFNATALFAKALPKLNPPQAIYALLNADTAIPLTIPSQWIEVAPRYEAQVADYPIEQGGFAAYNKVRRPRTIDVVLGKTGSDLARFAWLAAIEQQEANNPLQLYTIITPQGVYADYTITRLSYQTRQDRGQNFLYLELQFSQVQQIQSAQDAAANPLDAKSGPVAQLGRVYSSVATTATTALATAKRYIGG